MYNCIYTNEYNKGKETFEKSSQLRTNPGECEPKWDQIYINRLKSPCSSVAVRGAKCAHINK